MKNLTFQPVVLVRIGLRILIELFLAWQMAQMFFHDRSHLKIFTVPGYGSMFEPAGWGWPQEFRTNIITYIGKGAVHNEAIFARSYPIHWQALGIDLVVYLILGVVIFWVWQALDITLLICSILGVFVSWLLSRLPFLRKGREPKVFFLKVFARLLHSL